MAWQVIEIKEKQVKKGSAYLKEGRYLFSKTKIKDPPIKGLIGNYCKMKGRHFGWTLPLEEWTARVIFGVDIPINNAKHQGDNEYQWELETDAALTIRGMMRSYQKRVLQDVYNHTKDGSRFTKTLIAPLGSGKTLMGLAIADLVGGRVAIAAPRYLHDNWRLEAQKWSFNEPFVTTYEGLKKIGDGEVDVLILDENLRTKNQSTKRSKEAQRVANGAKVAIGMTATPLSSRGVLDWCHVNTGHKGAFPNEENIIKYMFGINPHMEPIFPGSDIEALVVDGWDSDKVTKFLMPYVHTIAESEVHKFMPKVTTVKVHLDQPPEWDDYREGWYSESDSSSKSIAQSRQLCSGFYLTDDGEVESHNTIKLDWIKNFLKDNPTERVIIFSAFIEGQRRLEEGLKDWNPACNFSDRDSGMELARFNAFETNLLLCSAQLVEGFNIHYNCNVGIYESNCFSSMSKDQGRGRLDRPGQPKPVTFYELLCEDTLDERLLGILDQKVELSREQVIKLLMED